MRQASVVVVGNRGGTNIGAAFENAGAEVGCNVTLFDSREASAGSRWLRRAAWHLCGHRPTYLSAFSRRVLEFCIANRPDFLVATGSAPLTAAVLRSLSALGVRTANFATDDPWNSSSKAAWFLRALRTYDIVFSPRTANLADLRKLGCGRVHYLPFGYQRDLHFVEAPPSPLLPEFRSDVLFVGGADVSRAKLIAPLVSSGLNVALYGDYWYKFPTLRKCWRGYGDVQTVRWATWCSQVALCVVRRANRDGHTMRSFEIAACGGCMLAEETSEHRDLFGDTVFYFGGNQSLRERACELLKDGRLRTILRSAVRFRIAAGRNTYADRLDTIVNELRSLKAHDS